MDSTQAQDAQAQPLTRSGWFGLLDGHGAEHGLHSRIGAGFGALYTDDDDTLLVTFEMARTIRYERETHLPYGLEPAGKEGWSHLCFYAEEDGFFRDEAVFNYIDGLIDDGFFDDFEKIVFYGAGPCAYAASAFSVAAPGSTVVLVNPIASLATDVAGFDRRYLADRRKSFTGRYSDAAAQAGASEATWVIYDPMSAEDAAHAALFLREGATLLPARHMGGAMERHLGAMGLVTKVLLDAGRDRLTPGRFFQAWRQRRASAAYLHRFVSAVEDRNNPMRLGLVARSALGLRPDPRFDRLLEQAEVDLAAEDQMLPPVGGFAAQEAAE